MEVRALSSAFFKTPPWPETARGRLASLGVSERWPMAHGNRRRPSDEHWASPHRRGVIHHAKPDVRSAMTAPPRSVRSGFLRSNPRIEAVLLRRWQSGLIAAGTAPPSPRCVDSAVAVGARYDPRLALARRPHSRTLPPFLAYQWPPSGYH